MATKPDQTMRPGALTDKEMQQLMGAFTRGKKWVSEADCLTLAHWAEHHKLGAMLLLGIFQGHLIPDVTGEHVTVHTRHP